MLYELQFGHEKALKMKDFYTVLKIAFPGAASSLAADASSSPIFDGTSIFGIQMKTSFLEGNVPKKKANIHQGIYL